MVAQRSTWNNDNVLSTLTVTLATLQWVNWAAFNTNSNISPTANQTDATSFSIHQ